MKLTQRDIDLAFAEEPDDEKELIDKPEEERSYIEQFLDDTYRYLTDIDIHD